MSADRQKLAALLQDKLALDVAVELGYVKFPDDELMDPIRRHCLDTATKLLDVFERESMIVEVRALILKDIKKELLHRSRIARAVEWGLIVASLGASAVIGIAQFVFLAPPNVPAIVASYWVILLFVVLIFFGFVYLKIIDPT